MSNKTNSDHVPPPSSKKKKLKIMAMIFILIAIIYLLYWLTVLQFRQSTDNAYVMGNLVPINSQIDGAIATIYTEDTAFVRQNSVVATIEPADVENRFEQAKSQLASTIREIQQLQFTDKKLLASIQLKKVALDKAQGDLARREALWRDRTISKEEVTHARQDMQVARNDLAIAQHQLEINQAQLMQTPLLEQPTVQQAIFKLREAWLELKRANIVAPVTGYIAKRNVQVGEQIKKGDRLMVVVPLDQIWVDANFKEVQLKHIRIGQKVTLTSDYYGDDVVFDGTITGINMGTGSAFSLLPAQNATGNWIKVIQRLPVRIELDKTQLAEHPLRVGLSMYVNVDTRDRSGPLLNDIPDQKARYQTNVLSYDQDEFEQLIQHIVKANSVY